MSCNDNHCTVSCCVSGCAYNKAKTCCADHIKVENDMAETKAETYCSTFKAK